MLISAQISAQNSLLITSADTRSFGQVQQGDSITETFPLTNTGTLPLKIHSARFSMPGMAIRVKQQILPGETVEAQIRWDTSSFSGPAQGQALLSILEPRTQTLLLTVHGEVIAPVDVLPMPALYLSQFYGESIESSLTLRNNSSVSMQVTGTEAQGVHFTHKIIPVLEGREYAVQVRVPDSVPPGRYRESLLIRTDHPERPTLGIEVNILVKPEVYATLDSADFGTLSLSALRRTPKAAELTSEVFLVKKREGQLRILGIESDIPFLDLKADHTGPASGFKVEARLDLSRATPGPFRGLIRVHTDDAAHPTVQIPVTGAFDL